MEELFLYEIDADNQRRYVEHLVFACPVAGMTFVRHLLLKRRGPLCG